GLVIFLAFLISVLIFAPLTKVVVGLLVASGFIVVLGFLDDFKDVKPFIRLFVQFLATIILVIFGIGILSIKIPFLGVIDFTGVVWQIGSFNLVLFSAFFTILWVMSIVNTMNFIDGISGLSSGVTFIGALVIFLLSIHPGIHEDPHSQVGVAIVALILAMVSLAFLLFDFPKPKILMGDTGSTFLGFALATLAIFSGGKVATAFLVLGIPILDMIWVVLRRVVSGQKFWKGDLKHLHHRLLDLGVSESMVVLLYLFFTAILGCSAVFFVNSEQKLFMGIALIVLMVMLAFSLVLLPKKK
ncbi:MraY family glycosyltransferase, partial [Patescibacteria group bacterium]